MNRLGWQREGECGWTGSQETGGPTHSEAAVPSAVASSHLAHLADLLPCVWATMSTEFLELLCILSQLPSMPRCRGEPQWQPRPCRTSRNP
ncbi:hypothetical protein AAFF_G00240970 [Aldrovandia affinis]|uniref:Uncharacterized protein n=1 Tax=Aldrovandia affinis TaxID=143900 RepID=A0AAD7WTP4_9TELE|nr:hypothetical protein AAFF_G00240970 [Aldrovandia affinis]